MRKAFNCTVHNFLTSKLEAYGFIHEALNVMKNYLSAKTHTKRKRINIAAYFSIY